MKFCFRPFFHLFFIGITLSNFSVLPVFAAAETPFVTIVLNEVLPQPTGDETIGEFVELKNMSAAAVDLKGWYLLSGSGAKYILESSVLLNSNAILSLPHSTTQLILPNAPETLRLYDQDGTLQDEMQYSNSVAGKSFSRFVHNPTYAVDSSWEWSEPTPGAENVRTSLTVQASPAGGNYTESFEVTLSANKTNAKIFYAFSGNATPEEQWEYTGPIRIDHNTELWYFAFTDTTDTTPIHTAIYTISAAAVVGNGYLLINEIYPNTLENQTAWVELFNRDAAEINLTGYSLTNSVGQKYVLGQTVLPAGKMLAIYFSSATFSLNSEKDSIRLYADDGTLLDIADYQYTAAAQSLVRLYDSESSYFFGLTTNSTPGTTNNYSQTVAVKKPAPKPVYTPAPAVVYYEPTPVPPTPDPLPTVNQNNNAPANENENAAPASPPAMNENENSAAAMLSNNANASAPAFNENQNLTSLPLPVTPSSSPTDALKASALSADSGSAPGAFPLPFILGGILVMLAMLGFLLFAKKKA